MRSIIELTLGDEKQTEKSKYRRRVQSTSEVVPISHKCHASGHAVFF